MFSVGTLVAGKYRIDHILGRGGDPNASVAPSTAPTAGVEVKVPPTVVAPTVAVALSWGEDSAVP